MKKTLLTVACAATALYAEAQCSIKATLTDISNDTVKVVTEKNNDGENILAKNGSFIFSCSETSAQEAAFLVKTAEGIKTNVTLIFSANQALLAARAGATYVSPFLGRLDDISQPGIDLIRQISEIFAIYDLDTEIISASVRNPIHVTDCALAGADIATVPYSVIEQMTKHPLTDQGIAKFQKDYEAVFGK